MNMNILAAAALLAAVGPAHAQQYQTLNTGQSSPVWNTSASSWSAPSSTNMIGSTFASTWTNGNFATFANPQTVNVTAPVTAAGFQFAADNVAVVGSSTVTLSYSNPFIDNRSGGADNLISATLAGTSGLVVYGTSNTRVTLAGVNTYTGSTTVSLGGALAAGTGTSGGFGAFGSSNNGLTLNGGTTADLNGFNLGVGSLDGTGTVTNSSSTIGTLTAGNNGSSASFAGSLTGNLSLTKAGSGTLTLTGTQTYTGGTRVSAGALRNNGTLASAVTVESGATLGGGGIFNGLVTTQAGARLSPGNNPGTVTFSGGLNLAGGATLDFELGNAAGTPGVDSDLIVVTAGTLTGSTGAGGVVVNLSNAGAFGGGVYNLISYAGSTPASLDLSDFAVGSAPSGYSYSFGFDTNTVQLTATAIPEVSSLLMAGLAGAGIVLRRRLLR